MPAISPVEYATNLKFKMFTWTGVTNADTFVGVALGQYPARKVAQLSGTFGSATVTIQGSMDGVTYYDLTTDGTNAAALTAAGILHIYENPLFFRASAAGGGGTQSVTVRIGCAASMT